jgi:hypothetical protein
MNESGKFFRGSELPRLLVLLVIVVIGWVLIWQWVYVTSKPENPEPVAAGPPPPVVPDQSPAFETVRDKTPIALRDSAAYDLLLNRARKQTPADLAAESRRDILFTHLLERPAQYRGVPVHLLGRAMRALTYESKLSPTGRLYEVWIGTHESQYHPYVCIFEDLPKGFPVDPNITERVVFNGYFLKLMAYQAGDVPRVAPVLVGRLGWTPPPKSRAPSGVTWMMIAVGAMFLISLFRWIFSLRRSLKPSPRPSLLRDRPNDQIAPDELSAWVESASTEDEPPRVPDESGR